MVHGPEPGLARLQGAQSLLPAAHLRCSRVAFLRLRFASSWVLFQPDSTGSNISHRAWHLPPIPFPSFCCALALSPSVTGAGEVGVSWELQHFLSFLQIVFSPCLLWNALGYSQFIPPPESAGCGSTLSCLISGSHLSCSCRNAELLEGDF